MTATVTSSSVVGNDAAPVLRRQIQGAVLTAGDARYDTARRVFNHMIDRRPALIVQPATTDDVRRSVLVAREHGLPLSVRGGGHNIAGSAVCTDGLMLDFAGWQSVAVDADRRAAVAQPGVLLAGFDTATQAHGLATPLGTVSATGIAGLTLGGGIGWLHGTLGLACDNLLAAEVVTADGDLVHASATEHPDLFWALRGGSGNFGVVTAFTYALHPVGQVLAGALVYAPHQTAGALRAYDAFAATCPDELALMSSLSTDEAGQTVYAVSWCWSGAPDQADQALAPLRRACPPAVDESELLDYCALQRSIDDRYPGGRQHYWKSTFLSHISADAIATMLHFAATRPGPAPLHGLSRSRSSIALQHVHGAAARIDPTATAFPHRHNHHDFMILSQWSTPEEGEAHITWTREFFAAMRPFTERAAYVNDLGEDDGDRVHEAYGVNYPRLAMLKARYDPENLFRANQNIAPGRK